jgi:mono/diheme cytochrome c family protein
MKKVLRILGLLLGVVGLAVAGFSSFVAISGIPSYPVPTATTTIVATPARVAHGEKLVASSCAECHLNPGTGTFSGQLLRDLPQEFGSLYSANITQDKTHGIGGWTDGQLVTLLRTGIGPDGRFRVVMPSFVHMSDEDITSIVSFLRSNNNWVKATPVPSHPQEPSFLSKALVNTVMKPTPLPAQPILEPAATDAVALGRYLVVGRYKCYDCHSADFKTNNALEPEKSDGYLGGGNHMLNLDQKTVVTRNLTMDEDTGLGDWTPAQFMQAIRFGSSPHGPLAYPMPKYSRMSEQEAQAIWAYLQTVPKLKNATPEDGAAGQL